MLADRVRMGSYSDNGEVFLYSYGVENVNFVLGYMNAISDFIKKDDHIALSQVEGGIYTVTEGVIDVTGFSELEIVCNLLYVFEDTDITSYVLDISGYNGFYHIKLGIDWQGNWSLGLCFPKDKLTEDYEVNYTERGYDALIYQIKLIP